MPYIFGQAAVMYDIH